MTFLIGRVIVKVEGRGVERYINRLIRNGIIIWDVKREKNGNAKFFISLSDIHRVRKAARNTECRISFIHGEGLPFLWKRARKNSGFLIGLFIFFFIATLLSNITWGIYIEGADPETESHIREELDEMGVRIGAMHLFVDKPDMIQKKLTDIIENITWVGVELKGTTYHFQVVQKTEPEQPELKSPRHLVASKRAVIAHMFIEKGKPIVKVNQFVKKGEILVSGLIGSEDHPQVVTAKGEVLGYTWYKTDVELPLEFKLPVYNGEEMNKHALQVGDFSIPIWGFNDIHFEQYETETSERDIFFLNWKLPITYLHKTFREKEITKRTLTKEEAIEAAKSIARRDLQAHIPKDAKIDKENILHEEVENGKVKLSINFQVIENIAQEKAIIQGD